MNKSSNPRAKQIVRKILAFIVAGLLLTQVALALQTGHIKTRGASDDLTKDQNLTLFWTVTSVYAVGGLVALYVAITSRVNRSRKHPHKT